MQMRFAPVHIYTYFLSSFLTSLILHQKSSPCTRLTPRIVDANLTIYFVVYYVISDLIWILKDDDIRNDSWIFH